MLVVFGGEFIYNINGDELFICKVMNFIKGLLYYGNIGLVVNIDDYVVLVKVIDFGDLVDFKVINVGDLG